MKILVYLLVISFMIGITAPYGEVYLKANPLKSSDHKGMACCENGSSCDPDSSCATKNNNLHKGFCPLCPSIYSFTPYLPKGEDINFMLHIISTIPFSQEFLSDQGYVKSIFHPPTCLS